MTKEDLMLAVEDAVGDLEEGIHPGRVAHKLGEVLTALEAQHPETAALRPYSEDETHALGAIKGAVGVLKSPGCTKENVQTTIEHLERTHKDLADGRHLPGYSPSAAPVPDPGPVVVQGV